VREEFSVLGKTFVQLFETELLKKAKAGRALNSEISGAFKIMKDKTANKGRGSRFAVIPEILMAVPSEHAFMTLAVIAGVIIVMVLMNGSLKTVVVKTGLEILRLTGGIRGPTENFPVIAKASSGEGRGNVRIDAAVTFGTTGEAAVTFQNILNSDLTVNELAAIGTALTNAFTKNDRAAKEAWFARTRGEFSIIVNREAGNAMFVSRPENRREEIWINVLSLRVPTELA